jgi:hypothetical protein
VTSEAASRLAAPTSTSWLDLFNFMRIFHSRSLHAGPSKQAGH